MQLEGKIVLVTGAASGLGAATAIACACEGADVYLVDRDADGLAATAARVAELGRKSGTFQADLSQRQPCLDAVANGIAHFGEIHGLCNIAGITLFHRVEDVTEAEWNLTVAITLSAPFWLSQAAIPELIRSQGSIVNIAGSGAIKGTAYTAPYSSCKAAIIHMTRCMAMEFINEPIRINCVAPGGMMTNIMQGRSFPTNLDRSLVDRFAGIRPPADPADVASAIVFMLSDAARNVHGSIFSVDGGITAG